MGTRFDMSDVLKASREIKGAGERIRSEVGKLVFGFGADVASTAAQKYRSASSTTSTATRRRTGQLARSISHRVDVGPPMSVEIGYMRGSEEGNVLEYAAAHEFGAEIRPRNSKYLAIPLEDSMTEMGVARGKPRDFDNTYVIPTRGGGIFELLIMQENASGQDLALFGLTRRTMTIPARPSLQPAADEHLPAFEASMAETAAKLIFEGTVALG